MSEDVCHFTNIGIMLATRCTTLEVLRLKVCTSERQKKTMCVINCCYCVVAQVAQESFSVLTLIDVASSLPALRQLFLSPVDFTPVYNRTRDNALVRSASMPNVTCRMTNRTAPGADVVCSAIAVIHMYMLTLCGGAVWVQFDDASCGIANLDGNRYRANFDAGRPLVVS
jgi:hypothetical protein